MPLIPSQETEVDKLLFVLLVLVVMAAAAILLTGCAVQIHIGGNHGCMATEDADPIGDTIRDGMAGEEISMAETRSSCAHPRSRQ